MSPHDLASAMAQDTLFLLVISLRHLCLFQLHKAVHPSWPRALLGAQVLTILQPYLVCILQHVMPYTSWWPVKISYNMKLLQVTLCRLLNLDGNYYSSVLLTVYIDLRRWLWVMWEWLYVHVLIWGWEWHVFVNMLCNVVICDYFEYNIKVQIKYVYN